nr:PREDICTED: uncharacterized protein LOC103970577 isoform X1 [Musa acuminata subsp. malaccensis]
MLIFLPKEFAVRIVWLRISSSSSLVHSLVLIASCIVWIRVKPSKRDDREALRCSRSYQSIRLMAATPLPLRCRLPPPPPPTPQRRRAISSDRLAATATGTTSTRLHQLGGRGQPPTRVNAVGVTDLAPVEITWQIAVGALAGITPFVVAGIEFSKRIIAQRKCEVCAGSGLVLLKDKSYVRCPGCGGFLPWQSWKRFFTG